MNDNLAAREDLASPAAIFPRSLRARCPAGSLGVRLGLLGILSTTTALVFLLFFSSQRGAKLDFSHPHDSQQQEAGFYQWRTSTSYGLVVNNGEDHNHTLADLCHKFPSHQLLKVQPVLKTGHQVLDRVRNSLQSTSACLDNLLIFSDLDEEVDGRPVIDIIADTPRDLLESTSQTDPYFALHEAVAAGLEGPQMKDIEGWKIDKFKFLPAISRAWKVAPDKLWYVFYEGDTHIVWDTVFRLLENFDPDAPHYFGSPSPGRDGTWFANGGPGYVVSRGAMRLLVRHDWNPATGEWLGSSLAEKYWGEITTDCCGDSILGLVMDQHSITLKGLWPMFNPHPLHGVPFADLYWCQPVLSMHKSTQEDTIKFWDWEWTHRQVDRPLLWRDIAISYLAMENLTRKDDWDNGEWDAYPPAKDDPHRPHESAEACGVACEEAEGSACFQWTYHLHRCWFVRSFRLGRAREQQAKKGDKTWPLGDQRFTAGWNTGKIQQWIAERPCHDVQWIRPSIKRIF